MSSDPLDDEAYKAALAEAARQKRLRDSGWQVITTERADGTTFEWTASGERASDGARVVEWGTAASLEEARGAAVDAWDRLRG